jgi:pyridinium-3,5-biscarboxylic acid mononucleotide sulfurtransferase
MVTGMNNELQKKVNKLEHLLKEMSEVVIAVSGGVDSLLLAKVAHDLLGDRALAVTADSPSLPRRDLNELISIVHLLGIPHKLIPTSELDNPDYAKNPANRCYFCKEELFDHLEKIKRETGSRWILFGENVDDQSDHRPGSMAASEHGVRAPLKEAGFYKQDIRQYAKILDLPVWDKPASACLASRIPYGQAVTEEKLAQVEKAEDYLYDLGFRNFRVRHHGEIARIELDLNDMQKIIGFGKQVNQVFAEIGFLYTAVDLAGYRRGSLNEGLIQVSLESG